MTDQRDMTEQSSEEIRRDIDRTRSEMDEKANALEQKLSPGELFEDLWDRVKRNGGVSQFGDVVRDHPVPIALMALGLGWLAIERATGSEGERLRRRYGHVEPGNRERAEGRRGPYMPDDVSLRGESDDSGRGIGEKMGEFYWGPLVGGGIESWLAYVIALLFLLYRPQGLFGEKIIERI